MKAQIAGTQRDGMVPSTFDVKDGEDFRFMNAGIDRVELFGERVSPARLTEMVNRGEMDEMNMRSIIRQAGMDSQLEELEGDGIELSKEDLAQVVKGILEQGTELFGEEEMNDDSVGFKVYDPKNIGVVEDEAEERNSISGLFNKEELDLFNEKLEEVSMGKTNQFKISRNGEYIFAILDKLVYTNGDITNPYISEITQIKLKDETDIDNVRKNIFDYEEGLITNEQMRRTLRSILGLRSTRKRSGGIWRTVYRPIRRRSGSIGGKVNTSNQGKIQSQSAQAIETEIILILSIAAT